MRTFLILVLLGVVAAVGVVWMRSRSPAPPPAPAPAPVVTAAVEAVPENYPDDVVATDPLPDIAPNGPPDSIKITREMDLFQAMRELGIEDMERALAYWAVKRGYPEYDESGNLLLEQPYQQYDDDTLRALADSGDMWAQQILAQRLADKRPADAIELYRQAAANGSVYAMTEIARLYHMLSGRRADVRFKKDDEALEQIYAIRDTGVSPSVTAYAWIAAAEQSGWDPTRSASLENLIARKLSDEQLADACELAGSMRDELESQRAAAGLEPYDMTPPPILYSPGDFGGGSRCYSEGVTGYDVSGCREVTIESGETSSVVWLCSD